MKLSQIHHYYNYDLTTIITIDLQRHRVTQLNGVQDSLKDLPIIGGGGIYPPEIDK